MSENESSPAPAVPPDPSPEVEAPVAAEDVLAPAPEEAAVVPEEVLPPPPPAPAIPLAPVAATERVEIIDIIRGMALFGILAANIRGFAGPARTYFMPHLFWPELHDRVAQAFVDAFVQGKFITIFAVLFGVGFGVQVDRALARNSKFNWTWTRRCLVLLLFGLVHGLAIWFGDILLVYALVGLMLLPFKRRKDKTLIVWAVILFLVPVALMSFVFLAVQLGAEIPAPPMPTAADLQKVDALFSDGAWIDIQRARMTDARTQNWGFFPMFFWQILAFFLIGMVLWRKGFFRPAPETLPRYRKIAAYALTLGVLGNVAMVAIRWILKPAPMPTTFAAFSAVLLQWFAVPALSLGYVALLIVLFHDERWRARIAPFGAIGRTAFSNYLLQSVLGTLIFYSYGLGFFGDVGPAVLWPVTFVIFAIQLVLSRWWLERYRFGPMEWVWRKLTYRGRLPMRRESAGALPEQAAAPTTP
jgi:uncharacterized protein